MTDDAIQLNQLCMFLSNEKKAYRKAIKEGKQFSDVKAIYLRVKALEKLLPVVAQCLLS